MAKKKKNDMWVKELKDVSKENWLQFGKFTLAWLLIALVFLLSAIAYMMMVDSSFSTECEFHSWKEVPEGVVMEIDDRELLMYPDYARCKVDGNVPVNMLAAIIVGLD